MARRRRVRTTVVAVDVESATDEELVELYRSGNATAIEGLLTRYRNFARMKARSYFLAGADKDDIVQEGMIGLYKAIRDFSADRQAFFRAFAEICITRQIITAVKTATRNKHTPLNQYVSFSQTPAAAGPDSDTTLEEVLPGPSVRDPANQVIAGEELESLVGCLTSVLSELESQVLAFYLDGHSYEVIGERLECDTKTVDNALQRVKRKVGIHLASRAVKI